MRVASALIILLLIAVRSSPAAAAGPPPTVNLAENADGSTIQYQVSGSSPSSGSSNEGPGTHTVAAAPVYEVDDPVLEIQGATFCIGLAREYLTDQAAAAAANFANEQKWAVLLGQWGPCPGVKPPVAAGPPPAAVAGQFWQQHGQDLLHKPGPVIQPGYALDGATAYLETHGVLTQAFDHATPAGVLHIVATGAFLVDWGDGSPVSGPYHDVGGPWPDGQITHVWDQSGNYNVTVSEQWTATWSLAGQSGQLTALQTVGVIPGFPVHAVVGVRNR